jgi:hypothetical protein
MSNLNYIETNKRDGFLYSVLLFDDKKKYQQQLTLINKAKVRQVLFSGSTQDMMNQNGEVLIGSRVRYYMEQKWSDGEISSNSGYPYYEIKPDNLPNYRHSVHKRFVVSEVMSTQKLADTYVHMISENKWQHYELGILKMNDKSYRKSVDSLANISTKGKYIIMLKQELA